MNRSRIVDLSYPVSSDMLIYPGTERPAFQWLGRANSEGYNLTRMTMLVHTGTHVDAPLHFFDGVPSIDEIPLDAFFGVARLFRYAHSPAGQEITLQDVVDSGLRLQEDEIFVLATGIENYAEQREYNYLFPYPSEDLAQWLVERKIKAYMTDATAVDPFGSPDSPIHHIILGAGIPIVENLRNLAELPENRPFIISALPLKLRGREGSPCRAVALPDLDQLG
jgi:kynurenine formamidase